MDLSPLVEWLAGPMDPARPHAIHVFESWHGRFMVLAWAVFLPIGVLIARFFKVMPRQDWPTELDNRTWWYAHLALQWSGAVISVMGLVFIFRMAGGFKVTTTAHHLFGWLTITLMLLQIFAGVFRGSKGGPTYPAPDGSERGDHFDMTLRRRIFEYSHKTLGYLALICGSIALVLGLDHVNAPVWMWLAISLWWFVLIAAAIHLQMTRGALDTYQAIWGTDPSLPGNRREPIGFGVMRPMPGRENCMKHAGSPRLRHGKWDGDQADARSVSGSKPSAADRFRGA